MMVKPSVTELLKKVDNQFELVVATSKRARQLSKGDKPLIKKEEASTVTLAADEIAEGKVRIIRENEEKKHIITIAGDHASGQGTLSNSLKENLGYEIYRNGQYVRKLASEKEMTISEFQVYLDEHPDLDRKIEKSATEYANEHDNLIIDAKLRMVCCTRIF
jgi:DNA-directed RNA polymerase omega subunit